jgi:hypothetical protein
MSGAKNTTLSSANFDGDQCSQQTVSWSAQLMLRSILWGGLGAGVGDSLLALALYRVSLMTVYQSVASGLLGRAAYGGGLSTAALGCALHFTIATAAAAIYVLVSRRAPLLVSYVVPCGLAFGVGVYLFMKYAVLPLSAVVRLTPFEPLAMAGHAFLVGLPIALAAAYGAR